ncbi:hypothetical protein [Lyngbya sp. CCY1209]|uniref:hypothetical protein n=1 Tax=Lyngbya sp. CCY1209 TaxID=2886103 RepID=UPI002D2122EB|nr:hypothetical protein [Lyngbya sp. CCY1209]MEB3885045.1 hypothetical protein [Lyngbya sp. CCY1209]
MAAGNRGEERDVRDGRRTLPFPGSNKKDAAHPAVSIPIILSGTRAIEFTTFFGSCSNPWRSRLGRREPRADDRTRRDRSTD